MKPFEEQQERHEFDAVTGVELDSSTEIHVAREQARQIVEADDLEAMCKTPGWQLVETHIRDMQAAYTDQLIVTTDIDEIRRLQETVKACANILGFVFGKIREGKSLAEEQDPA